MSDHCRRACRSSLRHRSRPASDPGKLSCSDVSSCSAGRGKGVSKWERKGMEGREVQRCSGAAPGSCGISCGIQRGILWHQLGGIFVIAARLNSAPNLGAPVVVAATNCEPKQERFRAVPELWVCFMWAQCEHATEQQAACLCSDCTLARCTSCCHDRAARSHCSGSIPTLGPPGAFRAHPTGDPSRALETRVLVSLSASPGLAVDVGMIIAFSLIITRSAVLRVGGWTLCGACSSGQRCVSAATIGDA